ncbi:hypothetical protein V6000_008904 [Aspergillus fumigatus]
MAVSLAANVRPDAEKAIEPLKPWPFSWWFKSPLNLRENVEQEGNNGLTKISKLTSPPGDMDHSKHCLYSRNCKRNILTNPEIY